MSFFRFLFGSNSASDQIHVLPKTEFAQALKKGKVQLVDVRTAREYKAGHIKGAKNVDFFNPSRFKSGFEALDKQKPVYVYCQSGNRSQKAARKLATMGFVEIFDLAGGYGAWSR